MESSLSSMQSVLRFNTIIRRPRRPKKQFICRYCGANFKRGEHLSRHERSHTLERPFKCTYCGGAFTRKDLLMRHCRNCYMATSHLEQEETTQETNTLAQDQIEPSTRCKDHEETALVISQPTELLKPYQEKACEIWQSPARRTESADSDSYDKPFDSIDISDFASSWSLMSGALDLGAFSRSSSVDSALLDGDALISRLGGFFMDGSDVLARELDLVIFDETCRSSLIAVMSEYSEQDIDSLLPSADLCQNYILTFCAGPGEHLPLVHRSFFLFDFLRNNTSCTKVEKLTSCVLFVAMLIVGTECSSEYHLARRIRKFNREFVRELPFPRETIFTDDEYLCLLQARLFGCMFDAWSGNVELIEMALDELPFLSRCCAQGIPSRLSHMVTTSQDWIIRESYHRLYWCIYVFMSNMNIAYGQITIMRVGDLGLPLPEPDVLWTQTEDAWLTRLNEFGHSPTAPAVLSCIINSTMDDIQPRYQFSPFSVNILLHSILDYLRLTNEVVAFCSTANVPATIELDYMRLMSFDHIDRIVCHLKDELLQFSEATRRSSGEGLLRIIDLRRNNVSVTASCLGGICDPRMKLNLPNRSTRSAVMTNAIAASLEYFSPFLLQDQKPVSIEQFLCLLESTLSIISWINQIEDEYKQGNSVSSEERWVVQVVLQKFGCEDNMPVIFRILELLKQLLVTKSTKSRWGICDRMINVLGSLK